MNVFVVYCHPSEKSFTAKVLKSFCGGLKDAGHSVTISDLYAMNFQSDLSLDEYNREGYYRADFPVLADVKEEQEKINRCDCLVFIYPVWWGDCPAKLKGWFDRVLTVGFAYGAEQNTWKTVKKALFLCTAGNSEEHLLKEGVAQSMRVISINDRIHTRAEKAEMIILGGQAEKDERKMEQNLQKAYEAGRNL